MPALDPDPYGVDGTVFIPRASGGSRTAIPCGMRDHRAAAAGRKTEGQGRGTVGRDQVTRRETSLETVGVLTAKRTRVSSSVSPKKTSSSEDCRADGSSSGVSSESIDSSAALGLRLMQPMESAGFALVAQAPLIARPRPDPRGHRADAAAGRWTRWPPGIAAAPIRARETSGRRGPGNGPEARPAPQLRGARRCWSIHFREPLRTGDRSDCGWDWSRRGRVKLLIHDSTVVELDCWDRNCGP